MVASEISEDALYSHRAPDDLRRYIEKQLVLHMADFIMEHLDPIWEEELDLANNVLIRNGMIRLPKYVEHRFIDRPLQYG